MLSLCNMFWTVLHYITLHYITNSCECVYSRVPQNCPRTYKLTSFDPDGDKVRCRYGNINTGECSLCDQPSGFHLDQVSWKVYFLIHVHWCFASLNLLFTLSGHLHITLPLVSGWLQSLWIWVGGGGLSGRLHQSDLLRWIPILQGPTACEA